jgi:hypothetical protein
MIRKYTLTLEKNDIEYILHVLSEQPFNKVSKTILEIAKQLKDQKVDEIDGDN